LAFALISLLVSCNKQDLQEGGPMFLEVGIAGMETISRSTPVDDLAGFRNAVDTFKVNVFKSGTRVLNAPTQAGRNGSNYQLNENYYWSPNTTLDVYAIAPKKATGLAYNNPFVDTLHDYKIKFTYDLSRIISSDTTITPSSMPDIMVAHYNGNGNNQGQATLTFHHALTALQFYTGNMIDMTINSVTLENINCFGTCYATVSGSTPTIQWYPGDERKFTYNLSSPISHNYGQASQAIAADANTFMIIPQETRSDAKLKLGVTISGTPAVLSCNISGRVLKPGKLYRYKINYASEGMMTISEIDVENWDSTDTPESLNLEDN